MKKVVRVLRVVRMVFGKVFEEGGLIRDDGGGERGGGEVEWCQ